VLKSQYEPRVSNTMKVKVNSRLLTNWVVQCELSDNTWFKPRKELWKAFLYLVSHAAEHERDFEISSDEFITIKSYLLSRNSEIDSNKFLSFEKTLESLQDRIEPGGPSFFEDATVKTGKAAPAADPPEGTRDKLLKSGKTAKDAKADRDAAARAAELRRKEKEEEEAKA